MLTIYSFIVFLLIAVLGAIPLAFFCSLVWPKDEQKKLWFHGVICKFFRWCAKHIPGVTVKVEGEGEEVFKDPAIVISNHQSHLDLLCLLMLTPRMVALTNRWVWKFPLYAPVIRYLDFIPAADGLEENQQAIEQLMKRGYSVLIFPEGTRTSDGRVQRFHRGAFYLSQQLKVPIVPVVIHGAHEVLPKTDFTLHQGTIKVTVGKPHPYEAQDMGEDYREMARNWKSWYVKQLS